MTRLLTLIIMVFQVSSAWALAGTIQNVLGTGKIHKQTGQIYPAIRNDQLYEGDTVIVDNASNLQIRMIDGAVVWLRSNTELKIDTYKSKRNGARTDESSLKLITGSLRTVTGIIGKQNPDGYKLNTPNATIGVRGTEFDAVYVSPSSANQFRAESGTYHRVFQGATEFRAGGRDQRVEEGQAVFASQSNPSGASKLQDIPNFLNLPPNSTQSPLPSSPTTNTTNSNSAPLLLSVRYGNPNENVVSSRGQATPSRVFTYRLENGKQSMVLGQSILGDLPLLIGNEIIDSSKYSIAIKASTVPNSDNLQLSFGDVQATGKSSPSSSYKLTLDLSKGNWLEVSSQGPWQSKEKVTRGRANSSNTPVFVMINSDR